MYEFCDTTETPKVNPLPAEAVCFNGVWIDNEVPGFRTLSVEGREFVPRNIDTYTVGNTDGAYYRGSSFGGRTITVEYQLIADNQYNFRESYNKLNSLLRATQCQLIFADEPDKYFVATRSTNGSIPTGRNGVIGTIAFFCADPKKYAVKEKEVAAYVDKGEVLLSLRNNGNMPVPINYDVICTSDNGYVGIENGENYIRFGNPEESDGENVDIAETLVTFDMIKNKTNDPASGLLNGVLSNIDLDGRTWVGALTDPGTGSGWHGARRTVIIPPDRNGESGAVNFFCYMLHWFQVAFVRQVGRQDIRFLDENDKEIIAYQIDKTNTSNTATTIKFTINGEVKKTIEFQSGSDPKSNPFFNNRGHNSVEKNGGTVKMHHYGAYYTFYDEEIANVAVKKIQFSAYANGTNEPVIRNYIGDLTFTKFQVPSWNNLSNRYSAGDVITINGEEGKMYVDGLPKAGDEMRGSEYFHAEPGENAISVHCSDWATGINVKARIREAWI